MVVLFFTLDHAFMSNHQKSKHTFDNYSSHNQIFRLNSLNLSSTNSRPFYVSVLMCREFFDSLFGKSPEIINSALVKKSLIVSGSVVDFLIIYLEVA